MGRQDIQFNVLKKVVDDLGPVFTTRDVSEDSRMKIAHFDLVDSTQYHAFVGGALSDNRVELGIEEIKKATARGSRWQKKWTAGIVYGEKNIKQEILKEVIDDLGPVFLTSDVVYDIRMMTGHLAFQNEPLFPNYVRDAMRNYQIELGIEETSKLSERDSHWKKAEISDK
ncbi:MAG: hypothetical protein GX432_13050 [Candidatus Atribacteria bacterium]|nr:hypothetical protein [Candidatus Atribacteria bacterium]